MSMNSMQRKGDPVIVGGWQVGLAAIRGHRFIEGEGGAAPTGGEGGDGGDGGQQEPGTETPPAAPTPPPAAPPAAPTPAQVAQQVAPKPPAAPAAPAQQQEPAAKGGTFSQEYVTELREEAKATRLAHTATQQELAAAKTELEQYRRADAVRAATGDLADPNLLLDSTRFQEAIAQVDLADTEAVTAAIKEFVGKNPAYSPTRLPGTSGGTPNGGAGKTPPTLEGAIAARLSQ